MPSPQCDRLRQVKETPRRTGETVVMSSVLYRCPTLGYYVEGHFDDRFGGGAPPPSYVAMGCVGCGHVHLVNPQTGRLPSEERPARPPTARRRTGPVCLPPGP